jgi:hypothetical protein
LRRQMGQVRQVGLVGRVGRVGKSWQCDEQQDESQSTCRSDVSYMAHEPYLPYSLTRPTSPAGVSFMPALSIECGHADCGSGRR